jgi:hypothetical protein
MQWKELNEPYAWFGTPKNMDLVQFSPFQTISAGTLGRVLESSCELLFVSDGQLYTWNKVDTALDPVLFLTQSLSHETLAMGQIRNWCHPYYWREIILQSTLALKIQ